MAHICYAFIKHFRALDQIEISLDPRYRCRYDPKSKVLEIDKKKDLPKEFWGDSIYSFTAIVGDNGAGKSTILTFLLNDLLEGATGNDGEGIYFYEEFGKLYYFGDVAEIKLGFSGSVSRKHLPSFPSFYYSSHFMPYVTCNDVRCYELAGSYLASDSWLLIKDIQSYSNIDSLRLNIPIGTHLVSHISQNNYRICKMLADKALRESFVGFRLPGFVLIGHNTSGQQALNNDKERFKNVAIPRPPIGKSSNARDRYMIQWIYNNLLNLYTDGTLERESSLLGLMRDWCSLAESIKENPIAFYRNLIWEKGDLTSTIKDAALSIADVLTKVIRLASFKEDKAGRPWFSIDVVNESNNLKELADCISSHRHLVSRFFDFSYTYVVDGSECILSSGEQELLNLFSRLYEAIVLIPDKIGTEKRPRLIMLDEAEVGFHPEWQRKYISLLIRFLESLHKDSFDYQVIITTHSPILLSDIPSSCVNYLKVVNGKSVNYVKSDIKTYATNIFDLFRDSFWLEDGMIGAYAYGRIKNLVCLLSKDDVKDYDNAAVEIEMIGDARIKDYLYSLLSKKYVFEAIRYYEGRIAELKKNINNHE